MNEFELLMGFGEDDQRRMLADQLRRRKTAGQMLSLSPTEQVSNMGKGMQTTAYGAAEGVANQRNKGLDRAYRAERDHEADARYRILKRLEMARANRPRGGGSTKQWAKTVVNGVEGLVNYATGEFRPSGAGAPENMAEYQAGEDAAAGSREYTKTESKKQGEWTVEDQQQIKEDIASANDAYVAYGNAVSALQQGADTGTIESYIPDFRESTIRLNQAKKQIALDLLGKYKLTPVSNIDLMTLFDVAIPENMQEASLLPWSKHKQEGLRRGVEALKATERAMYRDGPAIRNPNSPQYAELKAEIDKIMAGYDPVYVSTGPQKSIAEMSVEEKKARVQELLNKRRAQ